MRAREIQLKSIHSRGLATFHNFDPGVLSVFLHNRTDQNPVRVHVLDAFKLIDPDVEAAIADEFNVLPAVDFP